METNYSEDDDEIVSVSKKKNPLFFDEDDELSGLVDDDILEENKSKKKVTFGEVEDDYWDKISKKHLKSNKPGAYNTSFHFAGNPKKEQDMFNHMMGTDSKVADLAGSDSLLAAGADAVAGSGASGSVTGTASGAGEGGCSEGLENSVNYSSKLSELFDTIGFEVFKNSDGSYVAIDSCDMIPSITKPDITELVVALRPYIEDFVIYPLQSATAQKFTDYQDWVNWYNEANKEKFSKCAKDIEVCDLLANHLHECVID